jgi:MSHA biogenesis protein MshJ
MKVHPKIAGIAKSIDALSLRERLFVFAAALIVIGGAWEAFLAAPLQAREVLASKQVEETRQRISQLNKSIELTAQGMSGGMPNHSERLRALRMSVADGEETMRVFTTDLVAPDQMRFVLEDLVRRQRGLELISVSNLEGKPVIEDEDEEQDTAKNGSGPRLYRHGVVVVLEGRYLDALKYLETVERLPWQLYWSRLEVETEDYPRTRIVIELHTMSLEEEWIGV